MNSNADENTKRAWDAVIRELIDSGDMSEDVLSNSDSIIGWWRSLDSTRQGKISRRVKELSQSKGVVTSPTEDEGHGKENDSEDTLVDISQKEPLLKEQDKAKKEKEKKRLGIGCAVIVTLIVIGILIGSLTPSDKTRESSSPSDVNFTPAFNPPVQTEPVIPTSPPTTPTEPEVLAKYFDDVTIETLSTHEAISVMDDSVKIATLMFNNGANDTAYSILEDGTNEFILNITKIKRDWDAITPPIEYSSLHNRYSSALNKMAEAHMQMLTAAIAHDSLSVSITAVQNATEEMILCINKYDEALVQEASSFIPQPKSSPTPTLAPPIPDETEASENELLNIQVAIIALMIDNGLSELPNPVTVATNDMSAFPDTTAIGVKTGMIAPNGVAYDANDKAGFILFGHDIIGGDSSATLQLINYLEMQFTMGTYTVDAFGTVTQVTIGY